MEIIKVVYVVELNLTFTREEISLLFACAGRHYDMKCQAAAQPGGVLWGLRNHLPHGSDDLPTDIAERFFTFREVDLMAKITERPGFSHEETERMVSLHWQLRNVLHQFNELSRKANA
jgi:hypothetical protein